MQYILLTFGVPGINSVTVNDGDALLGKPVYLQVNSSGHILHAFVNGKYVGK